MTSRPASSASTRRRARSRRRRPKHTDGQQKIAVGISRETGATGLEPATSGVTGRVGRHDARRRTPLNGHICRAFQPWSQAGTAWLSQSSIRRLGHEWATRSCLHGQRSGWRTRNVSFVRTRSFELDRTPRPSRGSRRRLSELPAPAEQNQPGRPKRRWAPSSDPTSHRAGQLRLQAREAAARSRANGADRSRRLAP